MSGQEPSWGEVGRLTRLLPVACIVAAVCLFASDLMTMFNFTPPGGESLCSQSAADRHSNAQMVIAFFAIVATLVAVLAGSRPAAISVAVMGVLALLVFLISDLRVVNATGSLNDTCGPAGQSFFAAEAVPQSGFWMELVGALALAVTGIALATLTPEQLNSLRPPKRRRPGEPGGGEGVGTTGPAADSHDVPAGRRTKLRLPRRARQRG